MCGWTDGDTLRALNYFGYNYLLCEISPHGPGRLRWFTFFFIILLLHMLSAFLFFNSPSLAYILHRYITTVYDRLPTR